MGAILQQLGLDHTFFIQFGLFAILFLILSPLYFRPFLKLFQVRHKRTIEDRESAEKLIAQAEAQFEEYKRRINQERSEAKKDFEAFLVEVKKEEALILNQARTEAKKITQDMLDSLAKQGEATQKALENEVESFAVSLSETLLKRQS